jgi:protein TonB
MSYFEERKGSGRLIGFSAVALLHVALIWALANGLGAKVVEAVQGPIMAKIIDTPAPKRDEPPPPPPPAFDKPPPPFVPAPEINITAPPPATPSKAIEAVQSKVEAPARPSVPDTTPRSDPRHPNRQPDYPASSRRMGEQGRVVLLLYVTAEGTVQEARVDQSSGFAKLDKAAVEEATKSWRFLPATKGGQAVPSWHRVAVVFRLTT